MKYKILLIGCGNIGSRYLQGIVKSKLSFDIHVIDKSQKSIELAKKRLDETNYKRNHNCIFSKQLNKKITKYHLCIISTSSYKRFNIINKIPYEVKINNWIIEKVLTQNVKDLNKIKKNINTRKAKGWVNTSNRAQMWFKKIKPKDTKKNIKGFAIGSNWGMMCNSIHIIDLFSWWTSEKLKKINTDSIEENWFNSKRPGFMEVNGKIYAEFSKGSILEISCSSSNDKVPSIEYQFGNWKIIPNKGIAFNIRNKSKIYGEVSSHSEIITEIIDEIIKKNKCPLPSLKESVHQHALFIEAVLPKWQKFINKKTLNLPIT